MEHLTAKKVQRGDRLEKKRRRGGHVFPHDGLGHAIQEFEVANRQRIVLNRHRKGMRNST
ncbi:hypothetical protein YTPLAS18_23280 [Nitrospira sp.]|nr:hypothetical protein YTPLAS18_23280 [Nitrospira sp.]